MTPQKLYAAVAGTLVGAVPFWLLGFGPGIRWAAWSAIVLAGALSAAAFRMPAVWALGLVLGTVASWAAFVLTIGCDWRAWRLLPYMIVVFPGYYVAAGGALGAGSCNAEKGDTQLFSKRGRGRHSALSSF